MEKNNIQCILEQKFNPDGSGGTPRFLLSFHGNVHGPFFYKEAEDIMNSINYALKEWSKKD